MSRYTARLENGRTIAWGYDRPLEEYFIEEFYSAEEIKKIEDEMEDDDQMAEEVVFSLMSHTTTKCHPDFPGKMDWSNMEIFKVMKNYIGKIPKAHLDAVAEDLPF